MGGRHSIRWLPPTPWSARRGFLKKRAYTGRFVRNPPRVAATPVAADTGRAMSQENLAIARQMIACVNRADDEGLAALMADDVKCFPGADQPEPPFQGREQFLHYARSWTEAFDQYAVESSQYLDVGEYVVITGRTVARGRGSGVELSSDDAWVVRFRDGEAIEYREYETREEALDAVGTCPRPRQRRGAVSDDAWVVRLRDGRAIEYREYETRQEALDAVGLAE